MAETSQQAVIDFLSSPAAHGGHAVERIDTHAASVFLSGSRAIKIKRAVRFPFLDFSTLEKRRKACEAEIAINRAYAPGIYRAVVPITREQNGVFAIGGKGQPIEWAVEMRRFDESQTLDHLAEAGRIDAKLADALGRAIAAAHKLAPSVTNAHFTETLADITTQNEAELAGEPELIALADLRQFAGATRAALERVSALLQARERAGLVRRCHGDLHLGNIVLIAGKPVLFDAIEFDERIATSDVFYDLAFLLMDLVERGQRGPANIVLNRYLIEAGRIHDLDALAALPLFMSIRAAIRAKVTAARRRQNNQDPKLAQKAHAYFDLAQTLLARHQPCLVAIGGLSGTGKSLLARGLGAGLQPPPGAVILRSDIERKRLCGVSELDPLPRDAYTPAITEKVYSVLAEKARRVLNAGHSAIVDAVFAQPSERSEIARAADGVRFVGLFLTAGLQTRVERVGARRGDASDADANVAQMQEQFDLGRITWSKVDASGTPEETLIRAMAMLGLA
jgi:uncharacterized protein